MLSLNFLSFTSASVLLPAHFFYALHHALCTVRLFNIGDPPRMNDQAGFRIPAYFFAFRAGRGASVDDHNEIRFSLPGNPSGSSQFLSNFPGHLSPFDDRIAAPAEFDCQPGSEASSPALCFLSEPIVDPLDGFPGQFVFFAQPEWLSPCIFFLLPDRPMSFFVMPA
jgi:hypothetical protein